ncbi:MAG: methylglyoxal synthase [Chloroflexi bacterium 13_1_40CM_68_21]|nr:MAG: methylglyoxal synthase [Chloroflexi bacterium 13_1_40CM_68_21]
MDVGAQLRVALIAHDAPKTDMLEWARWNRDLLSRAKLYATKHTGELVAAETGLPIELLLSGPQGGDAQVAAMIARREIDIVVFFWDPLATQPHETDVRSLIRLAVLHDVAIACNRRSADLMISSPLLSATPIRS